MPRRILVIDDTELIHTDFEKVLSRTPASENELALEALDRMIFAEEKEAESSKEPRFDFQVDHALQGQDGFEMVGKAMEEGSPYAVAFVDMRMPPGWDGLKTVEEISAKDPNIQLVICSAYSDYSWRSITEKVGQTDRLLILKKPFDQAEVYQLAVALSEKWQAESANRLLLNKLEAQVERRTEQLTEANEKLNRLNSELQIAADEARAAERAKGRFLATMSHEIRTTLNGIIGASHMLNHSENLAGEDREFASIIQTSGDALMVIINDILDYSKYESGQLELEKIPFSLRDLARECVNLMDSSITKHNISLELDYDPNLPELVEGDPARIRQVVLNLLNNAIKFGRDGIVTMALAVEERSTGKLKLRISIKDRGIGMSQSTVDRLFSAFMQADSSTTREYGGTGLGLAICKLLADAMNATIEVDSKLGAGTNFAFTLDLMIPEESTKPVEIEKSNSPEQETESVRKAVHMDFESKKVLLVDDNAINRKLGSKFLKQMNIEVELATNGLEAYEKVVENEYDLVLMDLQMPELDGFEATQKIRASKSPHKDVTIIALTANAFKEVRHQCHSVGMQDFITKPLRVNVLSEVLKKWILDPSR